MMKNKITKPTPPPPKYIREGENPLSKKIKLTPQSSLYKLLEHFVLNDKKYGGVLYRHINSYKANLTVCPECRVDDFTHVEGCRLAKTKLKDIDFS